MPGTQKHRRRKPAPADWEHLPDDAILQFRVRDLGLQLESSPLAACVHQLYGELEARQLTFRPPCYLADEWFCPDKIPTIAIPFCLAHPRLKAIEKKMMLEVEGGTHKSCMQLLRHECGHAVNYAYKLYTRTRWRELFGPFSERYSLSYSPQPYSRRYVVHLQNNYAQAHPDEDFAETFAVWLTPDSQWQARYCNWPVIRKLRYVDTLMARLGPQSPLVTEHSTPFAASRMTSTLAAHYKRKREELGQDFPGYFDPSIRRIFSAVGAGGHPRASALIRRHKRHIVNSVSAWTGHRKFDIVQLVDKLARRCDALELRRTTPEAETLVGITSLVTAIAGKALAHDRGSKHL